MLLRLGPMAGVENDDGSAVRVEDMRWQVPEKCQNPSNSSRWEENLEKKVRDNYTVGFPDNFNFR